MNEKAYPDLAFLLQAYFHQNWAEPQRRAGMAPSYRQVVIEFREREPPEKAARVIADLDDVIAQDLSEPALRELSRGMGCQFYPPGLGMTYRAWFEEIRRILAAAWGGFVS
jgi:hypothetical protein